uniref:PE-PGRS family protein n=1 Tax=Parastrongyloides trichosuri TaxID=131310 RepID=A0A0N5A0A3_PARTI
MARIDDLDADGGGVDVGLALPGAATGVPGPALFGHQTQDGAVLIDDIVGRDLGLGVAQAGDRRLGGLHAGIVQHQHVRRAAPGVEVRGRRVGVDAVGHPGVAHLLGVNDAVVATTARRHGATGAQGETGEEDQHPGHQGDHGHGGGGEDGQKRADRDGQGGGDQARDPDEGRQQAGTGPTARIETQLAHRVGVDHELKASLSVLMNASGAMSVHRPERSMHCDITHQSHLLSRRSFRRPADPPGPPSRGCASGRSRRGSAWPGRRDRPSPGRP